MLQSYFRKNRQEPVIVIEMLGGTAMMFAIGALTILAVTDIRGISAENENTDGQLNDNSTTDVISPTNGPLENARNFTISVGSDIQNATSTVSSIPENEESDSVRLSPHSRKRRHSR